MTDISFIFFVALIVVGCYLLFSSLPGGKKEIQKPFIFTRDLIRKDANMALVYNLSCGLPLDSDVVERRLTVVVNGKVNPVSVFSKDTADFGEFTFTQDDEVVLSLVDVDDAGNTSPPATLEFVATDTLPPETPGGFVVSLVREVEDVTPSPEVLPDPSGIEEV